jgi:hypothetical protein
MPLDPLNPATWHEPTQLGRPSRRRRIRFTDEAVQRLELAPEAARDAYAALTDVDYFDEEQDPALAAWDASANGCHFSSVVPSATFMAVGRWAPWSAGAASTEVFLLTPFRARSVVRLARRRLMPAGQSWEEPVYVQEVSELSELSSNRASGSC